MSLPRLLNRRRGLRLAALVANGFGQALAALGTALLVQTAFDQLISKGEWQGVLPLQLGAGLLLSTLGLAWLRRRERVDSEHLGQDYVHELRQRLFAHLSRLPPRVMQTRRRGAVMLRFVGDLTAMRQWVSLGLARLLVAGVAVFGVLAALVPVNAPIAGGITSVALLGALTAWLLGRSMRAAVARSRNARARLAGNVSEKISCLAVVQAYGQRRREARRLTRQSEKLMRAMLDRAAVAGNLRACIEGTTGLATAATLMLGAWQVSVGQATAGTVAAAMTLIGLLLPRLRDLGRVQEYWYAAAVARERVQAFLKIGPRMSERRSRPDLQTSGGRIDYRNLSLDGSLQPLRAQVAPGQVVAVVGSNGAGKSSLLSLTARLIDGDAGHIAVDGQRIDRCNLPSLRRSISLVNPDLPLMRGSLRRNLRYRAPRASDEELQRVCELTGLDELIRELPDGLDTHIAEGGTNLSAGQRQRIAIARALVGEPKVLLLDEVDANLDPRAADTLDRVLATTDATVLMVSHRLERLITADEVWHLEQGRLIARGKPEDLLYGAGPTAKLFAPRLALAS